MGCFGRFFPGSLLARGGHVGCASLGQPKSSPITTRLLRLWLKLRNPLFASLLPAGAMIASLTYLGHQWYGIITCSLPNTAGMFVNRPIVKYVSNDPL